MRLHHSRHHRCTWCRHPIMLQETPQLLLVQQAARTARQQRGGQAPLRRGVRRRSLERIGRDGQMWSTIWALLTAIGGPPAPILAQKAVDPETPSSVRVRKVSDRTANPFPRPVTTSAGCQASAGHLCRWRRKIGGGQPLRPVPVATLASAPQPGATQQLRRCGGRSKIGGTDIQQLGMPTVNIGRRTLDRRIGASLRGGIPKTTG